MVRVRVSVRVRINPNPCTTVKVLGKGSGKDGRPLVADLIRLRENESKLVEELAFEKARDQAKLQALAAQEAEFAKCLERLDPLMKAYPQRNLFSLLSID